MVATAQIVPPDGSNDSINMCRADEQISCVPKDSVRVGVIEMHEVAAKREIRGR